MTSGPLFQEDAPLVRRKLFGKRRLGAILACTAVLAACGTVIGGLVLDTQTRGSIETPAADGSTRLSPGELQEGSPSKDDFLSRWGNFVGTGVDVVVGGVQTAVSTARDLPGRVINAIAGPTDDSIDSADLPALSQADVRGPNLTSEATRNPDRGEPEDGALHPGSTRSSDPPDDTTTTQDEPSTTEEDFDDEPSPTPEEEPSESPSPDPSSPSPEPSESPSPTPSPSDP